MQMQIKTHPNMKTLTLTQIALISLTWLLQESGQSAKETIQELENYHGIKYEDITIDSDDGIHIVGPTALLYKSGGAHLITIYLPK